MDNKELEKKLKFERVEACLNCALFTDCEDIGRFEDCENFSEVEQDKAMIIVSLTEYSASELR